MAPALQEVDGFDDDFDLPLPDRPLLPASSGPSSFGHPAGTSVPKSSQLPGGASVVSDSAPFKMWTCVYPIYIDAKRPYGTGRRRVAREKSCWWPHSLLIAEAAQRLRLPSFHEPDKTHPRDWENPGRVKILFKDKGGFTNRNITTKKRLLEALAETIQSYHASQTPLPAQIRPTPSPPASTNLPPSPHPATPPKAKANGNAAKDAKAKPAPPPPSASPSPRKGPTQVIKPPEPHPPISERYMPNSPLVESGVLVNTVKVALNQQRESEKKAALQASSGGGSGGSASGAGSGPNVPSAVGKGKKKVIRVRG